MIMQNSKFHAEKYLFSDSCTHSSKGWTHLSGKVLVFSNTNFFWRENKRTKAAKFLSDNLLVGKFWLENISNSRSMALLLLCWPDLKRNETHLWSTAYILQKRGFGKKYKHIEKIRTCSKPDMQLRWERHCFCGQMLEKDISSSRLT